MHFFPTRTILALAFPRAGNAAALSNYTCFYIPDNAEVFPSILLIHYSYITAEEFSSNLRPSKTIDYVSLNSNRKLLEMLTQSPTCKLTVVSRSLSV